MVKNIPIIFLGIITGFLFLIMFAHGQELYPENTSSSFDIPEDILASTTPKILSSYEIAVTEKLDTREQQVINLRKLANEIFNRCK